MKKSHKFSLKVCVVGAGQVGATFAYALLMRGLATEIVLIDKNTALAEGQAADLSHGLPYVKPANVTAGEFSDCANAEIIVITAGAAQKPGESRLDLTQKNVDIFKQIIPQITRYNTTATIIVVSNPVDVLTYAALKFSNFPKERIIGTGTTLDSARFRYLLSQNCRIDPRNVHAYIIGEHGDSEVPVWSAAHFGGVNILDYCQTCPTNCSSQNRDEIFTEVRDAAYHLIEKKGATNHAIGLASLTVLESIVRNQNTILSVSTYLNGYLGIKDVCLSVPTILNRTGVVSYIELPLEKAELAGLKNSADVIQSTLKQVGLR